MAIQLHVTLDSLTHENMKQIIALLKENNLSMDQVVERSLILFYIAVTENPESESFCPDCETSQRYNQL